MPGKSFTALDWHWLREGGCSHVHSRDFYQHLPNPTAHTKPKPSLTGTAALGAPQSFALLLLSPPGTQGINQVEFWSLLCEQPWGEHGTAEEEVTENEIPLGAGLCTLQPEHTRTAWVWECHRQEFGSRAAASTSELGHFGMEIPFCCLTIICPS